MQTPKLAKTQQGFTLIELVIVITILGVLAAIALPRFISTQTDARIAKLNAARGGVLSASTMIHSAYLTKGGVGDAAPCPAGGGTATNTVNGNICTENGLILLANGYPSGAAALAAAIPGIVGAAGLTSVFSPSLAQLNTEGFGAAVAGTVVTFSVIGGSGTTGATGAQTNATCSFTYTGAAAAGAAPVVSAVTTTGC